MPQVRVREAAELLGVSDDSVRRWIDSGALEASRDESGRTVVDGASLAAFARDHATTTAPDRTGVRRSARNRFVGLVTRVTADGVMAQVEMQCGPYRIVSLVSRESVDELGLDVGSVAIASIKATNVTVEVPA